MVNPEIIIIPTIFIVSYLSLKSFFDYRLKRRMVESGLVKEARWLVEAGSSSPVLNSVKWGSVFIGIGFAILISEYFHRYITEESMLGLIFLFAGVALVVYYFMTKDEKGANYTNLDASKVMEKIESEK